MLYYFCDNGQHKFIIDLFRHRSHVLVKFHQIQCTLEFQAKSLLLVTTGQRIHQDSYRRAPQVFAPVVHFIPRFCWATVTNLCLRLLIVLLNSEDLITFGFICPCFVTDRFNNNGRGCHPPLYKRIVFSLALIVTKTSIWYERHSGQLNCVVRSCDRNLTQYTHFNFQSTFRNISFPNPT